MKITLSLGAILLTSVLVSSCISNAEYSKVVEKNRQLEAMVERERKESSDLVGEKASLEDFNKAKNSEIQKIQIKSKEEVEAYVKKCGVLQANNNRLEEENKRLYKEKKDLATTVEVVRQEKDREIEDLKSKLRWVYVKYNVRRSDN